MGVLQYLAYVVYFLVSPSSPYYEVAIEACNALQKYPQNRTTNHTSPYIYIIYLFLSSYSLLFSLFLTLFRHFLALLQSFEVFIERLVHLFLGELQALNCVVAIEFMKCLPRLLSLHSHPHCTMFIQWTLKVKIKLISFSGINKEIILRRE